jgi:hypothetical protein
MRGLRPDIRMRVQNIPTKYNRYFITDPTRFKTTANECSVIDPHNKLARIRVS